MIIQLILAIVFAAAIALWLYGLIKSIRGAERERMKDPAYRQAIDWDRP